MMVQATTPLETGNNSANQRHRRNVLSEKGENVSLHSDLFGTVVVPEDAPSRYSTRRNVLRRSLPLR